MQNKFESDDQVAEQLNILSRGSKVEFGNLLTLPVGGGLLYVEPVYVQAEAATSFPLLRKVLVAFGDNVGLRGHLATQALDEVFAGDQARRRGDGGGGGTGTPPPVGRRRDADNPALAQALADAQKALHDGRRRPCQAGDFAAYGEAQKASAGRDRPGGRGRAAGRRRRRQPVAQPVRARRRAPSGSRRRRPASACSR